MKNSGRISGMIKKKAEQKRNALEEPISLEEKESLLRSQSSVDFQHKYVRHPSIVVEQEEHPPCTSWDSKSQPTHYQTGKEASLQCQLSSKACQPPLCDSCSSIQKLQKQNLRLLEQCVSLLERKHRLQVEVTAHARQARSIVEAKNDDSQELLSLIDQILKTINDQEQVQPIDQLTEYRRRLELQEAQSKQIEDLTGSLNRIKEVVMETQQMFDQTKRAIEHTNVLDPEALKKDIEQLYTALTSKKLNVSIDDSLMEPYPAETQQANHTPIKAEEGHQEAIDLRTSLKSDVTVFDLNQSTIKREVGPRSPINEPVSGRSMLSFTKKTQAYEPQHYQSMDNNNQNSQSKLLCFSDKRPPKRKQRLVSRDHDELHMMLLLQALTIERLIKDGTENNILY